MDYWLLEIRFVIEISTQGIDQHREGLILGYDCSGNATRLHQNAPSTKRRKIDIEKLLSY
jgi:hypothetical protein